jgi:hypothetical protein
MFKITGNYYSNCCHSVIMNNDNQLGDRQITVLVFRSLPEDRFGTPVTGNRQTQLFA